MLIGTERIGDGLRTLYDTARHLSYLSGLGVIASIGDDDLVFAYADAMGTAAYKARPADIPHAFRPSLTGARRVGAGDAAAAMGLVESRLRLTGCADDQFGELSALTTRVEEFLQRTDSPDRDIVLLRWLEETTA